MLGDLLHQFTGSPQGDEALQTLKDQHGLSGEQAKSALETAASGVATAVGSGEGGGLGALGQAIGGGGGGGVLGALGGLAGGGGGLASALQGGIGGAAAEKIADMIAPKIGIDKAKAAAIASTVLPYIVKFLQSRGATGGEQGGGEQQGGGGGGLGDVLGGAMKKLF
ncbi:MAG TPA: hypothetical protein VE093_13115 [Polyangiaceae bacterium]|jgi:nucleoid DNA-binding protein|nr:hypothetical protein [Polyangiaceae bacterium]